MSRQRGAVAEHAVGHPAHHLGLHLPLASAGPLSAAGPQVCAGDGDHALWAAHLQLRPVAPNPAEEAWPAQGGVKMDVSLN